MASYTGILEPGPHRAEDTLRCSASIAAMEVDNPTLYEPVASVIPLSAGTVSINTPIVENKTAYSGGDVASFLDDYYYRIHVNPATFALGAVLNPLEEEFIVWNAWFDLKTCTAINKTNPEEFTLDPETAPFDLSALEWATYTLGIPIEGSLEFSSTITFVFSGESPVVTITGTRVTIFPWEPLTPMREKLEWNTSIMRSRDGSEQRMILRPAPRQMFDVEIFLSTEQLQGRLDAKLFSWLKRTWGFPVWPEWTIHTDSIAVDDTVIYLDTTNADYRDESSAIIWQGPTSYEAIKISTVAADRLNLDLPIRNNWTGTKWIMPLRVANIIGTVSRPAAPDGFGRAKCSFLVSDNVQLTGYTAPTTYQSLPVITVSTLTEGEQDVEMDGDFGMVDYQLGGYQFYSDSDFNIVVQSHIVRKETKADAWEFRRLLHSLNGRRDPFWVLTDRQDIVQRGTIGAADTTFNIENIKLSDNMGLNAMRTHLAFVFPDGTHIYREITGMSETDETEETVSINSALGVEVQEGDCEICFLDKCRLTEDTVEMDWEEPFTMRCKFNVTKVKE